VLENFAEIASALASVGPRHQFDYAFHCPELRSVDFTAAANDNPVVRAVDATAL
jgi:hypothetical protein